jgi:hypothetical protein
VADYDDEKTLVQMNILKTIDQLVTSLEGTELLPKIEGIIGPALEMTIRNNLVGERIWFLRLGEASTDPLVTRQSSTTRRSRSSTR